MLSCSLAPKAIRHRMEGVWHSDPRCWQNSSLQSRPVVGIPEGFMGDTAAPHSSSRGQGGVEAGPGREAKFQQVRLFCPHACQFSGILAKFCDFGNAATGWEGRVILTEWHSWCHNSPRSATLNPLRSADIPILRWFGSPQLEIGACRWDLANFLHFKGTSDLWLMNINWTTTIEGIFLNCQNYVEIYIKCKKIQKHRQQLGTLPYIGELWYNSEVQVHQHIDLYFKNSMLRRETYIPKLFQGWSSWHPIVSQAPLFHLLTQKLLKGLHAPYLAAFCAAAPQSNKLLPEPLVDKLAVIAGAKKLSPGRHYTPPHSFHWDGRGRVPWIITRVDWGVRGAIAR